MDKILIVEDDMKLQKFLQTRLQKHKEEFEVILAYNGEETIKILEQKYISLLVTDIQMPKVDGLEVLKKIKSTPDLKQLPVIMLTTSTASADIDHCYDLGCNIYIVKPIEYENFSDALRKVGFFFSVIEAPNAAEAM